MPKESRNHRVSSDRPAPFPADRRFRSPLQSPLRNIAPRSVRRAAVDQKGWDEIRCPICLDHPHNAVLLHCSSHGKGCRPFMCNTSNRLSNCLDQYRKVFGAPGAVSNPKLACPLCRGRITGWQVVDAARKSMDAISRICSAELCDFTGDYTAMRMHARKVHPLTRPSDADSERLREWRRMEQDRDIEDLHRMLQPALADPSANDQLSDLF